MGKSWLPRPPLKVQALFPKRLVASLIKLNKKRLSSVLGGHNKVAF